MSDQVYVGLSRVATIWYRGLSDSNREVVDERLRELARDPERAPLRVLSPEGRTIYLALVNVDDPKVRGFRVDFIIDEVMRERGQIPAIAILRAKPLLRR